MLASKHTPKPHFTPAQKDRWVEETRRKKQIQEAVNAKPLAVHRLAEQIAQRNNKGLVKQPPSQKVFNSAVVAEENKRVIEENAKRVFHTLYPENEFKPERIKRRFKRENSITD